MLQLDLSTFPVLTTARLCLRAVALTDVPELFFLRSDPGMLTYLDKAPAASLEEVEQFIQTVKESEAAGNGVTWAITPNSSDTLIGTIGYWRLLKEHYRAEIGYALHPAEQGKGLMREALDAVLGYGFGPMGLHSVEANVNPANAPSIRLLERAGFVQEGYFRENYYYDGRFLDSAIYSLLAKNWRSQLA